MSEAARPRVGYYIHHHGSGHLGRFLAIRPHLEADVVCFSSLSAPAVLPAGTRWVQLERDDTAGPDTGKDPRDADPTAGGLLHWAPLGHPGHRSRLARIAAEAVSSELSAIVVDVSVEVAVFARLLGLPVVLIAQPGDRTDEPHSLAFRAATRIIAPWPRELLAPPHLDGLDVVYTGGISRFDGRSAETGAQSGVLFLAGRGGDDVPDGALEASRHATPEHTWRVLDGSTWVDDPWDDLTRASVVVAFAGQNSVADLAAVGARAIVIPQQRPFDEQLATAAALERAGLALIEPRWPEASRWQALIHRAEARKPNWSPWQTVGAATRAANAIDEIALDGQTGSAT